MKITMGMLREILLERYDSVLVEGRIEDTRERYPDISDEDFDDIVENQPQGSNNKYLTWCAKQVDDGFSVDVTVQHMRLFDGNKQRLEKKDINQYKDPSDIETAVKALGGKSKNQISNQARADTDTIYQDDRWLVLRPHTKEASCKYGVGTKWCIAATQSHNYFSTYSTSNNLFYFVIDKSQTTTAPSSKYAVVIRGESNQNNEAYDASDKRVPVSTVAAHVGDKWPDIWAKIQEHVKKVPVTREVEDERRDISEQVKELMAGNNLSAQVLTKIAKNGKLNVAVINRIYQAADAHANDNYLLSSLTYALSARVGIMPPDAAMLIIQKISENAGQSYYLRHAVEAANLSEDNFNKLIDTGKEEIISAIMSNPNCSVAIKDKIALLIPDFKSEQAKNDAYWALIKSGRINVEQMKSAMAEGMFGYSYLAQQALTQISELNLSPELIELIPLRNERDLQMLLKAPNLSPQYVGEVIMKLRDKLSGPFLISILKKSNISSDSIEQLWTALTPDVRTALLQNPSIGVDNASKFALSKNHAYRFAVAHNPITSKEDLNILAGDESSSTKAAVAANPNTHIDTLKVLAVDDAIAVRAAAASNSATGEVALRGLAKDTDLFVRKVARKTLKGMKVIESYVRMTMGMQGMLLEEMTDDPNEDIMNPSWRDIGRGRLQPDEFIAIFLLQNNGSATREEIESAWFDYIGHIGARADLWRQSKYDNDHVTRSTNAGGSGWFWAPPGIGKGALFQLTPQGAAAAMRALNKVRPESAGALEATKVKSTEARPGRIYYIPVAQFGQDVTGHEKDDIETEEVEVGRYNNQPVVTNGKYNKLSPNRSRASKHRTKGTVMFKFTTPAGQETYTKELPKVELKSGDAVTYVKAMHVEPAHGTGSNRALVKYNDKFLIVDFPFWTTKTGTKPLTTEPNVAPPVRKSAAAAPPRTPTTVEPGAERGPKTTYKIYGRFKGHPVATRLKGQAYVGAQGTQFNPGEQAIISPEDGKLRVKKGTGDHSQLWDPVDG